jgi:hypothetical protein
VELRRDALRDLVVGRVGRHRQKQVFDLDEASIALGGIFGLSDHPIERGLCGAVLGARA